MDKELNDHIREFFDEKINKLDITAPLKTRLIGKAFKDYAFYTYLPINIYRKGSSNISLSSVARLSLASYLYYFSTLYYDKIDDNQIEECGNCENNLRRDITYIIKDYAIKELTSLIKDNRFWSEFDVIRKHFLESSRNIDTSDIIKVLQNKSCLAKAYISSAKYLMFGGSDNELLQKIDFALDEFHVGFQLYDDYTDIKEDIINNQFNYYVYRATSSIQSSICHEKLKKYILISGIAEEGLVLSLNYLNSALETFRALSFEDQVFNIDGIIIKIKNDLHYLRATIFKTKQKAMLSTTFAEFKSLRQTIDSSISFLSKKKQTNGRSDFLTNAGVGRNWITGFVISSLKFID